MRVISLWLALLLLYPAFNAAAAGPGAVRKQVESSRLVTGMIDIDGEGRVAGYSVDNADELPTGVKQMFARVLPHWRFEPVPLPEGKTLARTPMRLRLVAKKEDADSVTVEIRGTQFGELKSGEHPASEYMRQPRYPKDAMLTGVGGMVYTVLKVGRDGSVLDAMAEQVNLRFIAGEHAMRRWRDTLANAALAAATHSRFRPPTRGPLVDAPYWLVRVPYEFDSGFDDKGPRPETEWVLYVPGPRMAVPWYDGNERDAPDAMAGTGIQPVGGGPRLLSPLQPAGS